MSASLFLFWFKQPGEQNLCLSLPSIFPKNMNVCPKYTVEADVENGKTAKAFQSGDLFSSVGSISRWNGRHLPPLPPGQPRHYTPSLPALSGGPAHQCLVSRGTPQSKEAPGKKEKRWIRRETGAPELFSQYKASTLYRIRQNTCHFSIIHGVSPFQN